jgi:hypothetical protein
VISTARLEHNSTHAIILWLHAHGMEENVHYHEITDRKVAAICYLDDRAYRFQGWSDFLKLYAWTR